MNDQHQISDKASEECGATLTINGSVFKCYLRKGHGKDHEADMVTPELTEEERKQVDWNIVWWSK